MQFTLFKHLAQKITWIPVSLYMEVIVAVCFLDRIGNY